MERTRENRGDNASPGTNLSPNPDAGRAPDMRVGLTGGIGAGKSTVAARLAHLGARIIDYDAISHALTRPGGAAIAPIREQFGPHAIADDGSLDRPWVASQIFGADPAHTANRGRLNAIIHPLVYAQAARQEAGGGIVVHDIPLLTEVLGGIPFTFRHIITVEAPDGLRVERLMKTRGMSETEARARMASQTDDEARRRSADITIPNDSDLVSLYRAVDEVWSRLCTECEGNGGRKR
ncbi:dephospho-CoA kinase [Pseudoscardovia radai]|uniref:Dephospho-CoA kinase n=1 Tax=Pseudoscardovia radai TaxID=987066 RepID=A0A261EUC5_9BIFI|nr:dephospho-CoA kinase [Pseudoscardovia radai]OZG50459.1 dephospho-CoA kinase [Pseudoscardovia radai]